MISIEHAVICMHCSSIRVLIRSRQSGITSPSGCGVRLCLGQVMQTRAATGEGTQAAAAVQEGAQEASQEPPAQPEGAASVESSSSHLSMGFLGALNQQRRAMWQVRGILLLSALAWIAY